MTGLLDRDILVISQRAKLIEMTNEYRILDPVGEEVGRSASRVSRDPRSCFASSATSISS